MKTHITRHKFTRSALRRRSTCCWALFHIFIYFSAFPANAEEKLVHLNQSNDNILDMDLEQIVDLKIPYVYAASRHEQLATKAPGSVSVITAEDIQVYGWRNIGEALNSVRGLYTASDRSFQTMKVRGLGRPEDFSNNGILITIDGVRMNEGLLGSATTSKDFPVDIDLIERIEVVRGPGSALYGSNAFFAVINVITKKVREFKNGEVSASVGTYDEYKERISAGLDLGYGWKLGISGTRFDRHGASSIYYPEFDYPDYNFGIADNQDKDSVSLGQFELGTDKFQLQAFLSERNKRFPEAPYETVFAGGNDVEHQRDIVQARYQDTVAKDLNLQLKAGYNRFRETGNYIVDSSEDQGEQFVFASEDVLRSQTIFAEAQTRYTIGGKHALTTGLSLRRHFQQDLSSGEVDVLVGSPDYELQNYIDRHADSSDIGIYSQAELQLHPEIFLTAGLRYSYYDLVNKEESFDPRLALIYQPDQATAFKALYGTAFRSPSAYELLYDDGGYSALIPDSLNPERIETLEFVAEHYFNKTYSGTLNAYRLKTSDFIESVFNEDQGVLIFENTSNDLIGYGIEGEFNANWDSGHRLKISYAWQENEDDVTNQISTNSPRQLLKANFVLPLIPKKFFLGFEEQYVSDRFSVDRDQSIGYWTTNINFLSKEFFIKGLDLSLGIYNVFDEGYTIPAPTYSGSQLIPQEGRTFRLQFKYNF